MPTNIALGVKGGGGNTKMRRTEIVSDDSTLFQIFCPRLYVPHKVRPMLKENCTAFDSVFCLVPCKKTVGQFPVEEFPHLSLESECDTLTIVFAKLLDNR